jgi:hypothetical protein
MSKLLSRSEGAFKIWWEKHRYELHRTVHRFPGAEGSQDGLVFDGTIASSLTADCQWSRREVFDRVEFFQTTSASRSSLAAQESSSSARYDL